MTSYYIIITFLFVRSALTQDIPTIKLCSEDYISISLQFGRIIHTQDTEGLPRNCTIAFTNVTSGGYTVLTGSRSDIQINGCSNQFRSVASGFDSYCEESYQSVVLRQNSSTSKIFYFSTTTSFTIEFYNSVVTCEKNGTSLQSSALSGVISSPSPGRLFYTKSRSNCAVILTGLPPQAAISVQTIIRLDTYPGLFSAINVGNDGQKIYYYQDNKVIVNTASDGQLSVVLGDRYENLYAIQFMLKYDVIRCGDIPIIEGSTHSEISPPYLPNSTVTYECDEGYESIGGLQEVTIPCSSTEEDSIAWTWNVTDVYELLGCQPVSCDLAAIINVTDGTLLLDKLTYHAGDTIDFLCDVDYIKSSMEHIVCHSNKSWSASPVCIKNNELDTQRESLREQTIIIVLSVTVAVLAIVLVSYVIFSVIRKRRRERSRSGSGEHKKKLEQRNENQENTSTPQNGLYEEMCNIQGQTTRPSPLNTDEQRQQTGAMTYKNPAYENAEFTDSRKTSTSPGTTQGMYEAMTTQSQEDHTYTALNQ